MKSKNLTDYPGELDFNLQVVSSELDTSAKRLRYFSNEDKDLDAVSINAFNCAWDKVKNEGGLITSINDNTELYEYGDDSTIVVLYEELSVRMIIVDKQDVRVIQNILKENKERWWS